jgi:tRNA(Ile2) C34 agmatinyltransferase TiaS
VSDDIDGSQPRCEECGVLMRDIPGGWRCPACGHVDAPVVMQQQQQQLPDFDGPSIHGG